MREGDSTPEVREGDSTPDRQDQLSDLPLIQPPKDQPIEHKASEQAAPDIANQNAGESEVRHGNAEGHEELWHRSRDN